MVEKEEELINQCVKGNPKAQKELFDKFAGKMMAVCLRYMKDIESAEDVFQEGMVKVFVKISHYNKQGSLEGWVRRVIVNTCLDQIRKNVKFKNNVAMDDVQNYIEFDGYIIESMSADDLLKIVDNMPDGYRIVFNMFAIEGYSHKEIADHLGITENTSKSQYSRARAYLRNKLEELEIER